MENYNGTLCLECPFCVCMVFVTGELFSGSTLKKKQEKQKRKKNWKSKHRLNTMKGFSKVVKNLVWHTPERECMFENNFQYSFPWPDRAAIRAATRTITSSFSLLMRRRIYKIFLLIQNKKRDQKIFFTLCSQNEINITNGIGLISRSIYLFHCCDKCIIKI